MDYRIMFASGPDGPGIVYQVSQFLYQHGCNIEDSRMAVLGGNFTLIMLFSGEAAGVVRLTEAVDAFRARANLVVHLLPAQAPAAIEPHPGLPVRVEIVAMDAPGILLQIAEILQRNAVNIESLEARLALAPNSDTTISSIKMRITVPRSVSPVRLKEELTVLALRINLDISFAPVQD